MVVRQTYGEGTNKVEFTWEGDDEGDARSGRGWASLSDGGSLTGWIFFHLGDDSGFLAVRPSDARQAAR